MTLGDITAVFVSGALACLLAYSVYRANCPSRWMPPPDPPPVIDADVATERLLDTLCKGTTRTQAAIEVGGVLCSVRWHVELRLPKYGFWVVKVGEHSCPAADLSTVSEVVRARLAAINRERAEIRGEVLS